MMMMMMIPMNTDDEDKQRKGNHQPKATPHTMSSMILSSFSSLHSGVFVSSINWNTVRTPYIATLISRSISWIRKSYDIPHARRDVGFDMMYLVSNNKWSRGKQRGRSGAGGSAAGPRKAQEKFIRCCVAYTCARGWLECLMYGRNYQSVVYIDL
jgi:hypothetical protein